MTIALQTEEAGRLIDKFDPSTTLWEVLLHFEKKASLNLTRKTQIPVAKTMNFFQTSNATALYVMPVCVFMNKEYSTISSLRSTSIRDLGLESGSAAIRLLGKIKENPISSYLEEMETPITPVAGKLLGLPPAPRADLTKQLVIQSPGVHPTTKLAASLSSAPATITPSTSSSTGGLAQTQLSHAVVAEEEVCFFSFPLTPV